MVPPSGVGAVPVACSWVMSSPTFWNDVHPAPPVPPPPPPPPPLPPGAPVLDEPPQATATSARQTAPAANVFIPRRYQVPAAGSKRALTPTPLPARRGEGDGPGG